MESATWSNSEGYFANYEDCVRKYKSSVLEHTQSDIPMKAMFEYLLRRDIEPMLSRTLTDEEVCQAYDSFMQNDDFASLLDREIVPMALDIIEENERKENLKIHSVNGEVYEFNVFSATLGYSRKHVFIYSVGKTEDDFIRCVLETFRRLGGLTQILKTDNMTAIVSLRNGNRKIHSRVQSFFNDLGVKLELCECRTPETKGKCESSNRFVNWLVSFDYRIKNEQELIHIIENQITSECNKEINRRTKVPPAKLFLKEKEFLKPFGNNLNMDTYLREHRRVKVPSTLLVSYNGKQYSVPTKYIGKVVDIYAVGSEVYIYHNSQLITVHTVTECKLNYKHEHYIDALSRRLRTTQDDIEELAMRNLERLENLGGD